MYSFQRHWYNTTSKFLLDIPGPVFEFGIAAHCMVQYNISSVYMIGGKYEEYSFNHNFVAGASSEEIKEEKRLLFNNNYLELDWTFGSKFFHSVKNATMSVTSKTWIWNPRDVKSTFGLGTLEGPSMNTERSYHSCGKIISNGKTLIVVSGGQNNFGEALDSVELLDPLANKGWITGMYVHLQNVFKYILFSMQNLMLTLVLLIN